MCYSSQKWSASLFYFYFCIFNLKIQAPGAGLNEQTIWVIRYHTFLGNTHLPLNKLNTAEWLLQLFVQSSWYKNICLASENITVNLNHICIYQVTFRILGGGWHSLITFTCKESLKGLKQVSVLNSSNLSTSFSSFSMCLQCFLITGQFLNSHRNLNYNNHMHSFPQERKHLL